MPSGAKKRKAAKKKMVQQIPTDDPHSSAPPLGDDGVQHYDEKESDDGSPASQDHHNSVHPFAKGDEKEVEEREDNSSDQLVTEKNLMEGVGTDGNVQDVGTEEGIVQIEWELKSEDDNESKEISIGSKEVHTGGSSGSSSSSSSSSSSDDESRAVEKKTEMVETGHTADSVKSVGSLSGAANYVDNNVSVAETTNGIASVVHPDEASLLEDVVEVNESVPTGYSENSSVGYKLDLLENADKQLPSSDEITGFSPVLMDAGSSKKDNEVVSTSEERPAVFVDAKDSASEGKEELVQSFNAPDVHTENIIDSENPECSDSKPLVVSAPQAVQKTSLKSCCGIFELFTSSDR